MSVNGTNNLGSGQNNRTIPGYSNPFEASRFRFKSVGIGLTTASFDALALEGNQYLLVGEQRHGTENAETSVFNLLVDSYGIAVNTSLSEWDRISPNHALYIDGDIYVTGNVVSRDGQLLDGMPNPAASSNLTYWKNGLTSDPNRIFHNGSVTVGTRTTSSTALYGLTVARPSNYRLSEVQLALQNSKSATVHMGFVGNASNSPYIVATTSNTPIEFHVGRGFGYFESMYRPGDTSRDIPIYSNASTAPMMAIDANGSVVIGWNEAPQFVYVNRVLRNGIYSAEPTVDRGKLHVAGLLYACNIVVHDPDTNTPKTLDSLYLRRDGATYLPSRIFPGDFAVGTYTFPYRLEVGDQLTTQNLVASNGKIRNLEVVDTLHTTGTSRFSDEVKAETDVYVRQNIYLQGGLFVESTDSNGSNIWSPIAFTSSNLESTSSNIISYQDGFYTTGRVGVGINESRGIGINEQLVVTRPNQTVMGIELRDESSAVRVYQGYMGHVDWRDNFTDGSLVFMTAPANQVDQDNYIQNMYFLPGKHLENTNDYLQSEVTPTLAVLASDQVVVGGFTGASSNARLTVDGDTYIKGDIYLQDTENRYFSLAKWREISVFDNPSKGLLYRNPDVTGVGIHTDPNLNYALNVAGKVYFPDGVYDFSQNETSMWYNTTSGSIVYMPPEGEIRKMFTQSRIGVGVVDPQTTAEIKSWDIGVPTQLTINQSSGELTTSILFRGTDTTTATPNFSIDAVPISAPVGAQPALVMRNTAAPANSNPGFTMIWDAQLQKHRITINETPRIHGSNLFPGSTNATMTVGGGLNVVGNVNVTGNYLMSGTIVINCNIGLSNNAPNPGQDNVYIYGNQIQLNPTTNLTVGYTQALFDGDNTNAVFRVYHPTPVGGVVARFVSQSSSALIELASQTSGKRFRIGLDTDDNFMIQSADTAAPYFYVKKMAPVTPLPNMQRTNRGTGYGTNNPDAFVHIVNDVLGEPTFRVTRSIATEQPGAEAFMDLERRIASTNQSYIWRMRGPDSAYMDRMTLEYLAVDSNGFSTLRRNALTVTKDGDMGLGTDTPGARIHLVSPTGTGVDPVASPMLRIDTQSNQPHFQLRTSNVATVYNMSVESNGAWFLHSLGEDNIANQRQNLLEFSSNGTLGIRDVPNSNYTVQLAGSMNLNVGGIFIDGVSILQGSNLGRQYDQRLYNKNFYILPDPEAGSVTVNRAENTGNWFHIRGRNDDPAVLTLESTTTDSWLYQQAFNNGFAMHRMGISNMTTIVHDFLPTNPSVDVTLTANSNYLRFADTKYLGSNNAKQFTQHFYGEVFVETPNSSNMLHMGTETTLLGLGQTLEITASNGTGFGVAPSAIVHIGDHFASGTLPNLRIDQSQNAEAMLVYSKYGSNILTVNEKGLGVCLTDPQHELHVNGTAFIEKDTYLAADLYVQGDAHNTSDRRVKENLTPIADPLEKLDSLTGYTYDRIDLGGKRSTGLIAQDVLEVLPEAVHTQPDGTMSIAYGNLMGLMVESIKALRAEVATLRSKLENQK